MKRTRNLKRIAVPLVCLSLGLVALLPRIMFGENEPLMIDEPGGGGGGPGGGPVTTSSSRTLDWSFPDWEISGSDVITVQTTDGQITLIEVRDNTGAVVFSMDQAGIQAVLAEYPSLTNPPPDAQAFRAVGAAPPPAPPATGTCGGPFTRTEVSIFGTSLRVEGNLH